MSELYMKNLDSYVDEESNAISKSIDNFSELLKNPEYLSYIVSQSVQQGCFMHILLLFVLSNKVNFDFIVLNLSN